MSSVTLFSPVLDVSIAHAMEDEGASYTKGRIAPPSSPVSVPHTAHTAENFKLFALPRELRDHIYDHALVPNAVFRLPKKKKKHAVEMDVEEGSERSDPAPAGVEELLAPPTEYQRPTISTSVKFRPSTAMLLSNRMLRSEYAERARLAMTLVRRELYTCYYGIH